MEPHLAKIDKQMFYDYLDKSSNYFEYGSGGSTYQAFIRKNIVTINSVESDLQWYNKLQTIIKNNERVNLVYIEMNAKPNNWGNPGPKSTITQWTNYSSNILKLDANLLNKIDFILIDGRFRVACCLKCFSVISDKCLIAFDDFLNRNYYHIVLDYYDIVNKTTDKRMVILRKKNVGSPSKEIIEKYEKIKE